MQSEIFMFGKWLKFLFGINKFLRLETDGLAAHWTIQMLNTDRVKERTPCAFQHFVKWNAVHSVQRKADKRSR